MDGLSLKQLLRQADEEKRQQELIDKLNEIELALVIFRKLTVDYEHWEDYNWIISMVQDCKKLLGLE